jgi:uncharacterized surface protein with fasciclin (FAS1) repeats
MIQTHSDFSTFKNLSSLLKNEINMTLPVYFNSTVILTVFAPINSAFEALSVPMVRYLSRNETNSREDLKKIIKFHIEKRRVLFNDTVKTRYSYPRFSQEMPVVLSMINKQNLTVSELKSNISHSYVLTPGQSNVVLPDIFASDGVVHGIDKVLLPHDFHWTLDKILYALWDTFSSFINRMDQTGLMALIDDEIILNYTLLAPNNLAWAKVDKEFLTSSLETSRLLRVHMVPGIVEKIEEGEIYQTMLPNHVLIGGRQGLTVTIQNVKADEDEPEALVNGTYYETSIGKGYKADNGYVFEVDKVLGVDRHPPSNAVRVVILLFAVIVVIALGFLGYWLYRRRQLQQSGIRLLD